MLMAWCWVAFFQGVVDGQKRLILGGVEGGGNESCISLSIETHTKKPADVGASAGFDCSHNYRKTASKHRLKTQLSCQTLY